MGRAPGDFAARRVQRSRARARVAPQAHVREQAFAAVLRAREGDGELHRGERRCFGFAERAVPERSDAPRQRPRRPRAGRAVARGLRARRAPHGQTQLRRLGDGGRRGSRARAARLRASGADQELRGAEAERFFRGKRIDWRRCVVRDWQKTPARASSRRSRDADGGAAACVWAARSAVGAAHPRPRAAGRRRRPGGSQPRGPGDEDVAEDAPGVRRGARVYAQRRAAAPRLGAPIPGLVPKRPKAVVHPGGPV
mmetsp:Transcript_9537/g.40477  ORF Transcript_9537/g.40477 Transcript_9537/m.40477 type:complete len:254 (-) Transcript_9537:448-1209(-)